MNSQVDNVMKSAVQVHELVHLHYVMSITELTICTCPNMDITNSTNEKPCIYITFFKLVNKVLTTL